jgi:fatty acid desaturase
MRRFLARLAPLITRMVLIGVACALAFLAVWRGLPPGFLTVPFMFLVLWSFRKKRSEPEVAVRRSSRRVARRTAPRRQANPDHPLWDRWLDG